MRIEDDREQLREVYRREELSASAFIPAKPKIDIYGEGREFRVCAYCRVSTDNDEQLSSYELQQAHYRQLVGNHPNWDLRAIYADEGISGTSLKNRDDFNRMIKTINKKSFNIIDIVLYGAIKIDGNKKRTQYRWDVDEFLTHI